VTGRLSEAIRGVEKEDTKGEEAEVTDGG